MLTVSVQPVSVDSTERIIVSCGKKDGSADAGPGADADISLDTCGDSFRTLNHLVQEMIEARTSELDIRKIPSSSGHCVSHAVFADGQTALIGEAKETSAFEESSEAVQMDAVQWSSTPVIHESYIDDRAGAIQRKSPLPVHA